jgi:hypothetical protein
MSLKKDKAKTSKNTPKKAVSKPKKTVKKGVSKSKTAKTAKTAKSSKKPVSKRVAQMLWEEYQRQNRKADENIPNPEREDGAPETPAVLEDQEDFMDVTDLEVQSSKGIIAQIRKKVDKTGKLRAAWGGRKRWNVPKDPHWIIARWPGKTEEGDFFKKGDKVLYFPLTKSFMAGPAAEAAWRQFQAELFDEMQYNAGMG